MQREAFSLAYYPPAKAGSTYNLPSGVTILDEGFANPDLNGAAASDFWDTMIIVGP